MGFALIKKHAHALFAEAEFISHINNNKDYTKALALMDELIEDYDHHRHLITILASSIEHYENAAPQFKKFNARIKSIDNPATILKLLMEQHDLGIGDFPEIGSKFLVSKIISHERRLTFDHIKALCNRFKLNPSLFF